jgi:hypothetical protein
VDHTLILMVSGALSFFGDVGLCLVVMLSTRFKPSKNILM